MTSKKISKFKKAAAVLAIAGAGVAVTITGQKGTTDDSEPTNHPKIAIIPEDDEKQPKKEVPPLVGDSDEDKNKRKWKMGKTTFRYTPEPLSPEKLKKVENKEKEILAEFNKYTQNMRGKTFSLLPANIKDEITPMIWPSFVGQVSFTETFFHNGGPDLSGYLTSGAGGTYAKRDRAFPTYTDDGQKIIDPKKEFKPTIRLFWDLGKYSRKVKNGTPMVYSHIKNITSGNTSGNYELKTYDFINSLSYEQKWRQAKLFLSAPGEALASELNAVKQENIRNKEPNEITPQLALSLISPFWHNPSNGKAIEFRLSDFEPTNKAFASTYKNEDKLLAVLKRLFWAHCESRGYLTPEMYLYLQVDGITALLDDYVKYTLNINTTPTIKDYIKAGVLIPYKEPYKLDKQAMTSKDQKKGRQHIERYHFPQDERKIKDILNYAKDRSKELQDNGQRNTILRQLATDLVENNMSAEDLFATNDYDDQLTPYQEILFERAEIYYSSVDSVERIKNLINGAEYEKKHTDDEQIKQNLEQIILEEKIHLTQIRINKSKGSAKSKYKEQLNQEIKDLNKFFDTKGKKTSPTVTVDKTDEQTKTKTDSKTVENTKPEDKKTGAKQETTQTTGYTTITIQSDDTLGYLAKIFKTTVPELKKLNDLKSSDIRAGDKLRIKMDCMYITIKSNDNLESLADKYKTTVPVLRALNGLKKSSKIYVGKKLLVPKPKNKRTSFNEASENLSKNELILMSMINNRENM